MQFIALEYSIRIVLCTKSSGQKKIRKKGKNNKNENFWKISTRILPTVDWFNKIFQSTRFERKGDDDARMSTPIYYSSWTILKFHLITREEEEKKRRKTKPNPQWINKWGNNNATVFIFSIECLWTYARCAHPIWYQANFNIVLSVGWKSNIFFNRNINGISTLCALALQTHAFVCFIKFLSGHLVVYLPVDGRKRVHKFEPMENIRIKYTQ